MTVLPDPAVGAAKIAVLIPCYNEAQTIRSVVEEFSASLPGATVYVYDNNSSDDTAHVAAACGAIVRTAPLQGKGNVVHRMFADIDAEVYVLVDGDGTYDPTAAPAMVSSVLDDGLDMVCAARVSQHDDAFRTGHKFGNRFLTGVVRAIFGRQFQDMLTGYRALSRRFVKSFPAHSAGFEIETELTVHTLQMRIPSAEIQTPYSARPEGSMSKLHTVRDGTRILRMIILLVRDERPLPFFAAIALFTVVLMVILGVPIAQEYLRSGLVPRYPSLIVTVGLAVVAMFSTACGLILDTVSRARLEQRRLAYLAIPGPRRPELTAAAQ